MKQRLLLPLIFGMAIFLCFSTGANAQVPDGFEVFFNDAQHSNTNGIDTALVDLINSAEYSVAGAFYTIQRSVIADAFIEAATRLGNDNVRIITDAHYRYHSGIRRMETAGLHIIDETCDGWDDDSLNSHHKFCVIDDQIVWTGSYNITDSGSLYNNNNAVKIDCPDLAATYLTEFNEMWGGTSGAPGNCRFSTNKNTLVSHDLTCNGVDLEVYFTPTTESSPNTMYDRMQSYLSTASSSIHFCIYTFTQSGFASKMIQRRDAGVTVRGVMDDSQANSYSVYALLSNNNMDVILDDEVEPHGSLLHHKFAVFDYDEPDAVVLTGSYNWTLAAQTKNDENSLFIHNEAIAELYYNEWHRAYFGFDPTPVDPSIDIQLNEDQFSPGHIFSCTATISNPGLSTLKCDEYIILDLGEGFGEDRFYFWPSWTNTAFGSRLYLGPQSSLEQDILQFATPGDMPACGPYTIWAGLLSEAGALIGEIDSVTFSFL